MKSLILLLALFFFALGCASDPGNQDTDSGNTDSASDEPLAKSQYVKMDFLGYRPDDSKVAIVTVPPGDQVDIIDTDGTVVYTVLPENIHEKGNDGIYSGDDVWWVDFSAFTTPGIYRLFLPALEATSYAFEIKNDIYNQTVTAALKSYYYQRCGVAKPETYADVWSDDTSCHPGHASLTHDDAYPEQDVGEQDLSGGWHDAGDYGKYVWYAVHDSIFYLLTAYMDNPEGFADNTLNIPESGNGLPDILDEIKWETDWLLKMQQSDGSVIAAVFNNYTGAGSPPSTDSSKFYYYFDTSDKFDILEAAGTFVASMAIASRAFTEAGEVEYGETLKGAAVHTWNWLVTQENYYYTIIAAAELFRLDNTVETARQYVDAALSDVAAPFYIDGPTSLAALTYVQSEGATEVVVTHLETAIGTTVDSIFENNDLYRNGMADGYYYWSSNRPRAKHGFFLMQAAKLGFTGTHSVEDCVQQAQNYLHFFHGQNTLRMNYLTNMAALGGEHSVWQIYHFWFGSPGVAHSNVNYVGKPHTVDEIDYPYFKGTDNFGNRDDDVSNYGPVPGIVTSGPNRFYSGTAIPPLGEIYYNRCYRDWNDDASSDWTAATYSINENTISIQGPYVGLAMYFMEH